MTMPRAASPLVFAAALVAVASTASARPEKPRPVPGAVGLTMKEVPLRHACTPSFTQVKQTRRGDEPTFAAVLVYPRLTGLDMNPDNQARTKASLKKFDTWFRNLVTALEKAKRRQEQVFGDPSATPLAKVEAAARTALLFDHAAHLIESVEVPRNLRTMPEAVEVFCDTLVEKTEPLHDQAKAARTACAKFAAEEKLAEGWFTAVCSPR